MAKKAADTKKKPAENPKASSKNGGKSAKKK
jgi:hypothetical protein